MGVDLVAGAAGLVEEGKLEEGADVGTLGGEGDKHGDVAGVVLVVLPVRVEVDGPVVAADGEGVTGEVPAGADALGEGETLDRVLVRSPHGLCDRPRPRRPRHRHRTNPRYAGLG